MADCKTYRCIPHSNLNLRRPIRPALIQHSKSSESTNRIDQSTASDPAPNIFTTTRGIGLISPYPSCTPPEPTRVGGMNVAPAWQDSGLVLSLHWLVVSFFALSFFFQAVDLVRSKLDALFVFRFHRLS